MLERIYIKQFAIIDELVIDFQPPFTVLTGETGAGKSIIIDAVAKLLGERAQSEMIRFGSEKAYIEGVFSLSPQHEIWSYLKEKGYIDDEQEPLVLSRELNHNGKNYCRINGRTVALNVYRQIALGLVDIHGQHDYQHLMQSQRQLGILDAYGGDSLLELKKKLGQVFQKWQNLKKVKETADKQQQERLARQDYLNFQVNEIDQAKLLPHEREELTAEIKRLSHSEKILTGLEAAYEQLFGSEDIPSAYQLIGESLRQLRDLVRYDNSLDEIHQALEPVAFTLDEVAADIRKYQDALEVSPNRLAEAENRLYQIKQLCQKYGESIEDVLKHRDAAAAELEAMTQWQKQATNWVQEIQELQANYEELAEKLHVARCETAKKLAEQIDHELADLAMPQALFSVDFQRKAAANDGQDAVEFLISSNTGEPYLPLVKIASGGELSRITLAMKCILAKADNCETMIFDEIDSGIGGLTAHAVGEKLGAISQAQQVICVTHSATIAAKANQHILLEKQEEEGRTKSQVQSLDTAARITELARMLGGDSLSPELRSHAQSLLKR
jgi:DNA repair protein RecN (Recombination protein N)